MVGAWKADQKDAGSNLFRILLFFLYSKSEGCWFESRHSKDIKFCLHKYEIFPPLFSSKGLRTCPTTVKVTKKYSTQKRRLGFATLYIVVTLWFRPTGLAGWAINYSPWSYRILLVTLSPFSWLERNWFCRVGWCGFISTVLGILICCRNRQ